MLVVLGKKRQEHNTDSAKKLQRLGKHNGFVRHKILMSVKFVSAILGPEMAAPILGTPGKMRPFCRKKPCP